MSHKKVVTQYNYELLKSQCEHGSNQTMTIPDQSTSIRDILTSYTRGGDLNLKYRESYYSENPDIENFDVLLTPDVDISDVHNELRNLNTTIHSRKIPKIETPEILKPE